ncbi:MAG: hypothetical protein U5P41_00225 [Gammaproteobacteria bacterium]|nr:hypothetical protein [Gammaproteobacteria bacterium]
MVMLLHQTGSEPKEAFHYPHGFDFDDALFLRGSIVQLNGLLPLLLAVAADISCFCHSRYGAIVP